MAELTVITHPDCGAYQPLPGHPEQAKRLAAALAGIDRLSDCRRIEAQPVSMDHLRRVHDAAYLAHLDAVAQRVEDQQQTESLDADTHAAPGSIRAARLASGAACQAVDSALSTLDQSAFAVVRPPGHHAETDRAMGFCFYNSIAVAAAYALTMPSIRRVAVCDFDVHHGNGTEEIVAGDERVQFLSSHQFPLWPGSGHEDAPSAGNIINCTLPPGSGSNQFRDAWQHQLLPCMNRFQPDLILVSAGFDAHWRDPLAQLDLKSEDFYWIGHQLKRLARAHCRGQLVAALEGGYDLKSLTDCTLAFAEGIH